MANKQTVQQEYVLNIKTRAEQATKELENMQAILKKLNIDPNFAKHAESVIRGALTKIRGEISTLGDEGFISEKAARLSEQKILKVRNQISNLYGEFEGKGFRAEDVFMSSSEYQKALKNIENLQKEYKELQDTIRASSNTGGRDRLYKAAAREELAGAAKEGSSSLNKKSAEIERRVQDSMSSTAVRSVRGMVGKDGMYNETKLNAEIKKKESAIKAAEEKSNGEETKHLQLLRQQKEALEQQVKVAKSILDIRKDTARFQQTSQALDEKKGQLRGAEVAAGNIRGDLIEEAAVNLGAVGDESNKIVAGLNDAAASADKAGNALGEMEKKSKGLSEVGNYLKNMVGPTMILMRIVQMVKQSFQELKELDKELNQISIVTGMSMDQMWSKFNGLNSIAQQYGVTTKDVVSVQKLYYQQGRSMAEVTQLTGETLKFAKISGLEFADATKMMTAALNAYKISADQANRVTDVYSALSTEAAVDANQVAIAMSKVASIAALSGSEFEDTSAYLSKIIETTQEAPETAGTALKTVIARFTEVKKLTEDQKELLDEDYNFNNIEKALKSIGISVKDSSGQMRGFTEILNDLGPMWEDLDTNQQHYIATMAAGSRQQSRFIALMDDWKRTEELVGVANESAGTGTRQLALAMDSVETSINKLKASWQDMYTEFLTSDFFKGLIDSATTLLNVLNRLANTPVIGPWLVAGLAASMLMIVKKAQNLGRDFATAFAKGRDEAEQAANLKKNAEDIVEAAEQGRNVATVRKKSEFATEEQMQKAEDIRQKAQAILDGTYKGEIEGNAKGVAEMSAQERIEAAKHEMDKIQAATDGTIEGTIEGEAHGKAEMLGQKLGKKMGQLKESFKAGGKAAKAARAAKGFGKGGGKAAFGVLVGKGAASTAGAAGASAGAAAGGGAVGSAGTAAAGKVGAAVVAAGPYAWIAAAIIAAILSALAITRAYQDKQEKKLLEKAEKIQTSNEEAKKKSRDLGLKYNEADELARKGMLKTADEAERYQEILGELKEQYPQLVKTMADGTMELNNQAGAYENLIDAQIRLIKNNNQSMGQVADSRFALSSGLTITQKGANLQEQIKTNAANLAAMDADSIYQVTGGFWSGNQKAGERLQKMSETGLNRQSLNDAMYSGFGKFWAGFSNQAYTDLMEEIANGDTSDSGEWGGRKKRAYKLINTLAQQSGMESAEELAKALIEDKSEKSQAIGAIEDLAPAIAAKYGATYSEGLTELFVEGTKIGETYNAESAEDLIEKYYAQVNKKDRQEFEKLITSMEDMSATEMETWNEEKVLAAFNLPPDMTKTVKEAIDKAKKARDEALYGKDSKGGGYVDKLVEATGRDKDSLTNSLADKSLTEIEQMSSIVAQVSSKYGTDAADSFLTEYENFMSGIDGNEVIKSAFGDVDLFDAESIAKFKAKLIEVYGEGTDVVNSFTEIIEHSANAVDRTFKNVSQVISSAKSDIKSLQDGMEKLSDAAEGTLALEDMFDLISQFPKVLSFDDFTATTEGYALTSDKMESVQERMIKAKKIEYALQIEQYKQSMRQLQVNMKLLGLENLRNNEMISEKERSNYSDIISNLDLNEYAKMRNAAAVGELLGKQLETYEEINKALTTSNMMINANEYVLEEEAEEALVSISELLDGINFKTSEITKKIEQSISALKNYIKNLEAIEVFVDLDAFEKSLQLDMAHYDFVIEFSTNAEEIAEATEKKIQNLTEQMNTQIARSQINRVLADSSRKFIEENYKDYMNFDDEGNLMLNEDRLMVMAKEIELLEKGSNEDKDRAKDLQDQYDLILKSANEYREYNNASKEAANNAEKQAEGMKKVVNAQREAIVEAEDMWRELLIQRDEDALEALEKRYDAMKEMDEEYLDSVREAVEEERRIRDNTNEYEDIAQMERKLNILRMSGGSAVEIQKLEQELQDKRQDWNDSQVDQILDDLEKNNEMRAAALDEEVEYEQAVLEEKKKNQVAYNEEIKAIMSKTKEEQLAIWQSLDQSYAAASEQNKVLINQKTEDIVNASIAAQETLTKKTLPLIEGKVNDLAKAIASDPNSAEAQVAKFAEECTRDLNETGRATQSVKTITDKFVNLEQAIYSGKNSVYKAYDKLIGLLEEHAGTLGINTDTLPKKIIDKHVRVAGKDYYRVNGKWYDKDQFEEGTNFTQGTGALKKNATNSTNVNFNQFTQSKTVGGVTYYVGEDGLLYPSQSTTTYGYRSVNLHDVAGGRGYTEESLKKERMERDWDAPPLTPEAIPIQDAVLKEVDGKAYVKSLLRPDLGDPDYYALEDDLGENNNYYSFGWGAPIYKLRKYKTGGLVDYTGPAWVDGTPTKPEAFLSARDTALISSLTSVLSMRTRGVTSVEPVQNNGDTYYEIHINVDELGDGYSVDDLIDEMEDRILQATGKTSVIKIR